MQTDSQKVNQQEQDKKGEELFHIIKGHFSHKLKQRNNQQTFEENEVTDLIKRFALDVTTETEKEIVRIMRGKAFFKISDVVNEIKKRFDPERRGVSDWLEKYPATNEVKIFAESVVEEYFLKKGLRLGEHATRSGRNINDLDFIGLPEEIKKEFPLISLSLNENGKLKESWTTVEQVILEQRLSVYSSVENEDLAVSDNSVNLALSHYEYMSEEQREAARYILKNKQMVSIYEGWAGAGKTATALAIVRGLMLENYHVYIIAPSHRALDSLRSSVGALIEEKDRDLVMAKFTYMSEKAYREGKDIFKNQDKVAIFVDEAGMINSSDFEVLLRRAYSEQITNGRNFKVVLTGDSAQLNSIGAGNAFDLILNITNSAIIKTIRRQPHDSKRYISEMLAQGELGSALYCMQEQGMLFFSDTQENKLEEVAERYISYRVQHPEKSCSILSMTNKEVDEIGKIVRKKMVEAGMISGLEVDLSVAVPKEDREKGVKEKFEVKPFARGDEITFREKYSNDKVIKIYALPDERKGLNLDESSYTLLDEHTVVNRTKGRIIHIEKSTSDKGYKMYVDLFNDKGLPGKRMVFYTEELGKLSQDISFPNIHHSYAGTVHSSQGETINKTFIVYSKADMKNFYVMATRYNESLEIHFSYEQLSGEEKKRGVEEEPLLDVEKKLDLGDETYKGLLSRIARESSQIVYNNTVTMELIESSSRTLDVNEKKEQRALVQKPRGKYYSIDNFDFLDGVKKIDLSNGKTLKQFMLENFEISDVDEDRGIEELFDKFRKNAGLPSNFQFSDGDYLFLSPKIDNSLNMIDFAKIEGGVKARVKELPTQEQVRISGAKEVEVVQEGVIHKVADSFQQFTKNVEKRESYLVQDLAFSEGAKATLNEESKAKISSAGLAGFDLSILSSIKVNDDPVIEENDKLNGLLDPISNTYVILDKRNERFIVPIDKTKLPIRQERKPYFVINQKLEIAPTKKFKGFNYYQGQDGIQREQLIQEEEFWHIINREEQFRDLWKINQNYEPIFVAQILKKDERNESYLATGEVYDQFGKAIFRLEEEGLPVIVHNAGRKEEPSAKNVVPLVLCKNPLDVYFNFINDERNLTKKLGEIQEKSQRGELTREELNDFSRTVYKRPDYGFYSPQWNFSQLRLKRGGEGWKILEDKSDPKWAIEVQEKLWNDYRIMAEIVFSKPNNHVPVWENAERVEKEMAIKDYHKNGGLSAFSIDLKFAKSGKLDKLEQSLNAKAIKQIGSTVEQEEEITIGLN